MPGRWPPSWVPASICGTGSFWRCWPRPGCASARRSGCGTPTSSAGTGKSGSCPRLATPTGRGPRCARPAVIPVSTPLVRLYSEYMHIEYGDIDSDYVFVNLFAEPVGQPLGYPAVHRLIGRIAKRAGVAFTAHMLRHTHATELIRNGVPIEVVVRLLTHRSSTTTSQTYIHLDAVDVREALTRSGVWDQAGKGNPE